MGRKFIPRVPCSCIVCGKAFEVAQADLRRGRGRFCSQSCGVKAARPTPPNRVCPACGTPVYRSPSQLASRANVYCSIACSTRNRPMEPLWSRTWRRIDYGGRGCWPWMGSTDRYGYGVISLAPKGKRRPVTVPRVVWYLVHGGWPIFACHHCDNPICCRPSHLFNGTRADNIRDMHAKGRWRRSTKAHQAALSLEVLGP